METGREPLAVTRLPLKNEAGETVGSNRIVRADVRPGRLTHARARMAYSRRFEND